jgi:AraC family transcriptional activator of pobA
MKKQIPIHRIKQRVDLGLEVMRLSDDGVREMLEELDIHRDDSYVFLLIEKGEGSMVVDFIDVPFLAGHVYYIAPGQVHYGIRTENAESVVVSVATDRVPKGYREVFEGNLLLQQPRRVGPDEFKQCQAMAGLLYDQFHKDREAPFFHQLIQSLLHSYMCLFAGIYASPEDDLKKTSRPFQITQQFKRLFKEKFRIEKSPSFYAAELHISEVYLNEVIKSVTGFNVTHWLMGEVISEAKRLLIYSEASVKEISYQLGYDDHAYFSRLFKKQTNVTPSEFRDNYLK